MYMFSFHIFFKASGATEAAVNSGPLIQRTYGRMWQGHSLHHFRRRLATTYQIYIYLHTYV